jgi:hypothetical protein
LARESESGNKSSVSVKGREFTIQANNTSFSRKNWVTCDHFFNYNGELTGSIKGEILLAQLRD